MKYVHLISELGPKAFSPSNLFRTDDFLLIASSFGFNESYRRVYFKDIQSIQVLATRNRTYWLITSGIGTALSVLITAAAFIYSAPAALLALLCLVMLAVLVVLIFNVLAGPSCRCVIHTAVQSTRLRMVNRRAKFEKMLTLITPLIEEHQGLVNADQLSSLLVEGWKDMSKPRKKRPSAPPPAPEPASSDQESPAAVIRPPEPLSSLETQAPEEASGTGPDETMPPLEGTPS